MLLRWDYWLFILLCTFRFRHYIICVNFSHATWWQPWDSNPRCIKWLSDIVNNVRNGNASKCRDKFPSLFQGLGKFREEYSIKINQDFKPFCLSTPRRVPLPLQNGVSKQLKEMEYTGVISLVTLPIEWCWGMVVVPQKSGKIRICVDYTHLSKFVYRENHILPAVDETLANLENAKFLTKLDANCGFWQILLC